MVCPMESCLGSLRRRNRPGKKILLSMFLVGSGILAGAAPAADADRITGGWTGRNLLGFLIPVGLFILAAVGIWRLADGGGGEGNENRH